MALSELNVARDIMDFKFVSNSEEEVSPEFYLTLTNWTELHLEIFVNFTDPMMISKEVKED